jgi:hypothetical protein
MSWVEMKFYSLRTWVTMRRFIERREKKRKDTFFTELEMYKSIFIRDEREIAEISVGSISRLAVSFFHILIDDIFR